MLILLLGLGIWTIAHMWKRLLPAIHQGFGAKAKGISALAIFASIVLMVIGYKGFEAPDLFAFPPFFKHINNLLVLLAFYFMSPGPKKGAIFYKMRHPMLTGFLLWTIGHILVNPDVGSYILFGGLAIWAIASIILINHQDKNWVPPAKGKIAKDLMFLAIAVLTVLVVGYIHGLVGPSPFGG